MKFKYKIVLFFLLLYASALIIINIWIFQNNRSNMLSSEINRNLNIEETVYLNLAFNLRFNSGLKTDKLSFKSFTDYFIKTFGNNSLDLAISNYTDSDLAPPKMSIPVSQDELVSLQKNPRSYILKHHEDSFYMIIYRKFEYNGDFYFLKTNRNISYIDKSSIDNLTATIKISLIISLFIIVLALLLGYLLMKPVVEMIPVVKSISSGNYSQRISLNPKKKDEFSELSRYFNHMAATVEDKIITLQDENLKKETFINNLSHEIRTPLTSIIGFSDLLMGMDYNKESFDKSLNYINSEGKRLLHISNLLLSLTKLKQEEIDTGISSSDEVLKDIFNVIPIMYKDSNVSFIKETQEDDFLFDMNTELIKLTIHNLIENAVKASSDGSQVIIGTTYYDGSPCFFVKDNGIGIPSSEQSKIFEPFYRVDKSRSRKQGGTGIGLSICSEVVSLHDGKFLIQSEVDKGSTFYIFLKPELEDVKEKSSDIYNSFTSKI